MSDLDVLREITGRLRPPEYDELVAVARKRRRRSALGVAAAAAVVILGAGIVGGALSGVQRANPPAQDPSLTPTESPSTSQEWTLDRIRAEGSLQDHQTVTESGITTRSYVVCDGSRSACENDPPLRVPYQHAALEVTGDGRSALFRLGAHPQYAAQRFDADSVFVMDDPDNAWGSPPLLRYRVLRADGTEVLLHLLDDPAPAAPGPGVFVIDFDSALGGLGGGYGAEAVYLVDLREGTLQPLDVPNLDPASFYSRYWGPNVDEFLWFVDPDCRVGWATDGTFDDRRLNCAEGRDRPTYIHDDGFPEGWLQPGRMALLERNEDRLFLHVSLDYGSTWQRIPVSGEQAIPDALRRLG